MVAAGAKRPKREKRPNVVIVVSDQQRADTMPGVRVAKGIRTPHLEWLAGRGTLFRNAFCVDPVCTPSRTSLFSGLYPHATGMVANHQERPISNEMRLPADVKLLADYLRPEGYACGYAGKWHLGTGSDRRGFADFVTHSGDYDVSGPEDNEIVRFSERIGVSLAPRGLGFDPDQAEFDARTKVGPSLLPLAFHPAMQDAARSADFIRRMAGDERPFLLAFSCHEPHAPFVSPEPFHRMYAQRTAELPLPETRREMAAREVLRNRGDRKLQPVDVFSDDDLRSMWAAYYGAVSYVDHLVGTLLAALVETNQWDDTLFIFTSDHGELLGSHGVYLKGAAGFDELIRIPLLICPPGAGSGAAGMARETAHLVNHVDLAPTILRWCGQSVPDKMPGGDLRSLVEGGDEAVHDGIVVEYTSGNWGEPPVPLRVWRTPHWKYVEGKGAVAEELYDLRADPLETRNLVDDAQHAAVRDEMRRQLHAQLRRTGDRWPEFKAPEQLVQVSRPSRA
ncbi:MAG: sulfatase-like hydrolase/transferase [Chloroflexota bacterium]